MEIDGRSVPDGDIIETDLCIVGGGVAGITIALSLREAGLRVVLLESGGPGPDIETRSLNEGNSVGQHYEALERSRSRFFGGSSNCWGGFCKPLDPLDFESRDWIPNSGWPFGHEELARFVPAAHELLLLGPSDYDLQGWESRLELPEGALRRPGRSPLGFAINHVSPPARFGQLYRSALEAASSVTTYLWSNATELVTGADGTTVTDVKVATLAGNRFTVRPKRVVLAAGGIENPRLLLASAGTHARGVGNANDLVGRYFMEHPRFRTPVFSLKRPELRPLLDNTLSLSRTRIKGKAMPVSAHLTVRPDHQRTERLPNSRIYLSAHYFHALSGAYRAMSSFQQAFSRRASYGVSMRELVREGAVALPRMAAGGPMVVMGLLDRLTDWNAANRVFVVETVIEPVPNHDSRVRLSGAKDSLGMPRAELDWRLTPQDKDHFIRIMSLLSSDASDIVERVGPKQPVEFPQEVLWCWHHMGTTRMHDDPRRGVVDRNCRVHGMANLFVAGSSVFPTVGCDMPTINIVTLSLRLADHLGRVNP